MKLDDLKKANELNKQIEKLEAMKSKFIDEEGKVIDILPEDLFDKATQQLFTEKEATEFNTYLVEMLEKKIKAKTTEFNKI